MVGHRSDLRVVWALAIVVFLACAGLGEAVTVAGCGECTLYAKKVWCPSSMTCHSQENCTCDVPCLDFRDCFYTEPTCSGCVSSFGVFCHQPSAKRTTLTTGTNNQCFFPEEKDAMFSENEASSSSGGVAKKDLPTCQAHCTGDGARCVSLLADCPSESLDRVSVFVATTALAISLVLMVLSVAWVLRRLSGAPQHEKKHV